MSEKEIPPSMNRGELVSMIEKIVEENHEVLATLAGNKDLALANHRIKQLEADITKEFRDIVPIMAENNWLAERLHIWICRFEEVSGRIQKMYDKKAKLEELIDVYWGIENRNYTSMDVHRFLDERGEKEINEKVRKDLNDLLVTKTGELLFELGSIVTDVVSSMNFLDRDRDKLREQQMSRAQGVKP